MNAAMVNKTLTCQDHQGESSLAMLVRDYLDKVNEGRKGYLNYVGSSTQSVRVLDLIKCYVSWVPAFLSFCFLTLDKNAHRKMGVGHTKYTQRDKHINTETLK